MAQADPTDPFANLDPFTAKQKGNGATSVSLTPSNAGEDPFANLDPFKGPGVEPKTTATGAAVRGFVGGAAPALAGVIPGAAAGATVGEAIFPWGGGLPGALAGGLAGAYFGAEGVQTAQNWALSKVPKLRDMLGQSEEQKRLDAEEHPTASFLGGLAPFAITLSPFNAGKKVAADATTWQRLAANPVTARLFSGTVMGGMQLGQEAVSEDNVNWTHVAVATGFGLIFNKPNRIGEAISEYGAKPARFAFGIAEPKPVRPPTAAEVSEQGVAGPGTTESTFMGSEQRNPTAEQAAIQTASVEDSLIGPVRKPDLENTARQKEPELFEEYDSLLGRRQTFTNWINSQNEPKPHQFLELEEKRAEIEKELADHTAARGGYDRGPRARQLKAQIREIDTEHAALTERGEAYKAGTAVETPDIAIARKHLMDTEVALRDLQPRIQSAYRAAAEYTGAPTVAPPPPEVAAPSAETTTAPPAGATVEGVPAGAAAPKPASPVDEQKAYIAKHAADQMIAAGEPPERAETIGHLVAAHYAARASRFGGTQGSALDLYKAEGERYTAGRFNVRNPPQEPGAAPTKTPTTAEELRAFIAAGGEVKAAPRSDVVPPAAAPPIAEAAPAAEAPAAAAEEALPPIIEMKKRAPRGPAAKDPDKYSLLEFLAKSGGIKPTAELVELYGGRLVNGKKVGGKSDMVPGFGPLFRPTGKTEGKALEAATEGNGYIHDEGRITGGETQVGVEDLRNLIGEEVRGTKQYRLGHAPPEKTIDLDEQRHHIDGAVDDEAIRQGYKPEQVPSDIRARMVELMERGETHDAGVAWERAAMELENNEAETGNIKTKSENIPGWDVGFPNEPGAAPGPIEGAPPRGGEPHGTEVGGPARPIGGDNREPPKATDPLAHLSQQDVDDFFQATRGVKQGAIRFTDDLRSIITRLPTADASTIVHELGHSWLEQLMRDSEHPAAPDSLRADAATVLQWLGLKNATDIRETTKKGSPTAKAEKAHERFATGFEQYLREGKAPSAELANVFARFKMWLTDLYKTITGLGKEISPDIRAVFDRMLTEEPQQTVIGEARPGGPTITEIHEADAKAADPHEGEQAAARVVEERDRYEEEQPANIKAELEGSAEKVSGEGAKPAGEGEPVRGGSEQVDGGGGGPKPIAAGGGGGEEPSPVVKGGTNARPEGASIPGAGREPGSATEREHPLAPGPAPDHIPRGESDAVDKAGNIRVENVTNVESVADAIHESADRNADFDGVRGATMGKGQMWDLASDMGLDPNSADLDALEKHMEGLLGGMKDMAPKVLAARRLLKQSAAMVADLMKRVSKSDSDEEAAELALAITRHDMIQSAVSGGTASWGRTGTAFHDISEGWDQVKDVNALLMAKTGRTLFQIKQIAKLGAEFDKTSQIGQFVRDSGKPSFGRMITEYWINGLISGIQTHLTYSVGNTILALEAVGPETAIAAGIGALRKSFGREGETVRIGEVAAAAHGAVRGFWPAVESGLQGLRTGVTTLLPGETPNKRIMPPLSLGSGLVKAAVLNETATFQDTVATAYSIVRGIRDGVVAGAALQRAGGAPGAPLYGWEYSHLGAIPNFQYRGVTAVPLGDIARAPSRMIAAIHSFFRPLNYSMDVSQRAYRAAANEGLAGAAFDSRVAGLTAKPELDTMQDAYKVATERTLMGAGSELTRRLSGLVNTEFFGVKDANGKTIIGTGMPILKFIDPFIHISSNIINQSIVQRTPLGILSNSIRADLMGKNGNVAADTAAARMLAGTALSILFGSLAAEGYVTGSEPSNREDAAIWRQVYQAHSVKIGDTWYAMNRLGPMGMLLSTAADLYNVAHQADQGEFSKAAAALMHGVTQNILDESFMRGPSDLIKAVDEPGRYGENYIKNMVASFVPFSVAMSQMARATDPYSRQARTVTDAIVAKVPLLSQSLMPRRDVWGGILPSRESLGPTGLLAIWEQKMNDDPVNKALINLGMHQGIPEKKIRNVELTPEQFDDWARLKGRLTKFRLDSIVRSPAFQNMPNHVKHDLITEQQKQAGEVARNMMFMKYPSILVDAQAAKMAKKQGPQ